MIGQAAFLGDLLCRLQQWVPEHGGKQERRVHAHIVMDTRIGILQHLFNDPLHRAVAIFREVAGNGREQRLEQVIFTQQLIGFVTVARLQQFQRFFKQTCRWNIVQQGSQARDRFCGFRTDTHTQFGGKTYRAQHPYRIFTVARFRVTNQTDNAVLQILHAANVITDGKICHAVIQAVDSEIAALGVFFDGAENVVAQQHAVLPALGGRAVADVTFVMSTEGRNFDNLRAKHHMSQTETATHQAAVTEQFTYLFRRGVSGYVKIFRLFAK